MNKNDSVWWVKMEMNVHCEAHALVEHPWHNKIKNAETRTGIDPNFFLIPFIKQQISIALGSFTSCKSTQPQLTRDICMFTETFLKGK